MKIIVITIYLLMYLSLDVISEEPRLLWSNEDTGISKILYATTSQSGDTIIIVEQHCIRLYDAKNFNLLRKIQMNKLKWTIPFSNFITNVETLFNVNLPYILYNNYLINTDSNSYTNLPINAGFYFDKNTNNAYVIGNEWVYGGKGERKYYGDLFELDFQSGKVKSLKEFSDHEMRNSYKIGKKFFILTEIGLKQFDTETLETKILIPDPNLRFLSDNYTETENFIHIYRNRNFIEYLSINKNDLTIRRDTLNSKLFLNKSAVLNIYAKSANNNPGLIFVNYSYLINPNTIDSIRNYGITVFDIENNKILHEFQFDAPATSINITNDNLNYYIEKVKSNDTLFTNTEIKKINLNTNTENLSVSYKQLLPKIFKYQFGEMKCFFENKVQKWDEYTGNILIQDTYDREIFTIHKIKDYPGNFILYKDNSLKHTNYENFIDYPFISNIDAENFFVTPDHKNVLFYNNVQLFVADPNTLQIKMRFQHSNQPITVIDDSTVVILNSDYQALIPVLMNITNGKQLNLSKKILGYLKIINSNKQNRFLGIGDKNLYKVEIKNNNYTDSLIYQHDVRINNAAESFDGKYFAFIALKNQNSTNIDNEIIFLDTETNRITSRIYSIKNEPITDLLFSKDNSNMFYTTYNFKSGLIQLIKYDVQNNVELQKVTFEGIVLANFDKSNFILKSNFLEFDDNGNLILNYVMTSSIILNPDDLSIVKTIVFTKNYIESMKLLTKNFEVIYQQYLYKINKNLLLTQETRASSTPQILSVYDIKTDKINGRIFKYGSYSAFYNNQPNYFMIYDGMKLTINPFDFNFKIDGKINLYRRNIHSLISANDSKILVHGEWGYEFLAVDLNSGWESKAFKEDGHPLNRYEFLNNDSILFTARFNKLNFFDLYKGQKYFEAVLTKENCLNDFKVTDVAFFKNKKDYVTSHFDGTIRFWRESQTKFTSKITLGSYPTNIFLFDDDKKLFVNTSTGYVYCFEIDEYIKSDVYDNSDKQNAISLSPNPASDFITISISEDDINHRVNPMVDKAADKIQIFDMLGIEVSSAGGGVNEVDGGGSIRIDISNLPAGVYFIKIGYKVEKFLKM